MIELLAAVAIITIVVVLALIIRRCWSAGLGPIGRRLTRLIRGGGTSSTRVIHVAGPEASGKTTLAERLRRDCGAEIKVYDIDDLFDQWDQSTDRTTRNAAIDFPAYVRGVIKPGVTTVLVGINGWKDHPGEYWDIAADTRYCIDIPTEVAVERLFKREIGGWLAWMSDRDKSILYSQLRKNQHEVTTDLCGGLTRVLALDQMAAAIDAQSAHYRAAGYTMLSADEIYDHVMSL
jgi:hypothetical protein